MSISRLLAVRGGTGLLAKQVEVQRRSAQARRAGEKPGRRGLLRRCARPADLEDSTSKHRVTPGQIASMRELVGTRCATCGACAGANCASRRPGSMHYWVAEVAVLLYGRPEALFRGTGAHWASFCKRRAVRVYPWAPAASGSAARKPSGAQRLLLSSFALFLNPYV